MYRHSMRGTKVESQWFAADPLAAVCLHRKATTKKPQKDQSTIEPCLILAMRKGSAPATGRAWLEHCRPRLGAHKLCKECRRLGVECTIVQRQSSKCAQVIISISGNQAIEKNAHSLSRDLETHEFQMKQCRHQAYTTAHGIPMSRHLNTVRVSCNSRKLQFFQ
jgi:hypothetical protein